MHGYEQVDVGVDVDVPVRRVLTVWLAARLLPCEPSGWSWCMDVYDFLCRAPSSKTRSLFRVLIQQFAFTLARRSRTVAPI